MPAPFLEEVIAIKKPNSICKNNDCGKLFYACAYCTHKLAWRAVACSVECHEAYMNQVAEARSKGKSVNLLPERTDMTQEEVKGLINAPSEEVIEATKEELADYAGELMSHGFAGTVEIINNEINEAQNAEAAESEGAQQNGGWNNSGKSKRKNGR